MKNTVMRFLKYSTVGFSTFLFDVLLLLIFVEKLEWSYINATGIAFLTAVSINYILSRYFVFGGTRQSFKKGYLSFIGIALIGLFLALGGMHILVGILGWNYVVSRVVVASIIGIGNYLFNLYFNFKVAGKH